MRRLALAATLALGTAASLVATPALAQKLGERIDVGGWKVFMTKNNDGSVMCGTTFTYDDKSIIGFTVDNDGDAFFLVSEPTAKMTAGEKYQISYRLDKGKSLSGLGIATSAEMMVVPIPSNEMESLFTRFQNGNSLFIKLGKEEFEEPLDGSSNAIGALGTCQSSLPPRGKK